MKVILSKDHIELGRKAAKLTAELLNKAIGENGYARLILSTGASQFSTISALVEEEVDWSKVEMFHLDEYVNIPLTHQASFVKYLQERFVDKVGNLKAVHFVDTTKGTDEIIEKLTFELNKAPVDVGLIGIGENAHIAFNDPPADFENSNAYKVVTLDNACRNQQLGEGWFATFDDVPKQAVSMTVQQILKCKNIISAVPFKVKAKAIHDTLITDGVTNLVPATILKTHPNTTIFVDSESAALIDTNVWCK